MTQEWWENKLNEMSRIGKLKYNPPASENSILLFERRSGIRLPQEYKEWLLLSDGGKLFPPAGVCLYGSVNRPLIEPLEGSSGRYAVIGTLSFGDPVLCENGGKKIAILNQDNGRIAEDEVFADFGAFLDSLPDLLGLED